MEDDEIIKQCKEYLQSNEMETYHVWCINDQEYGDPCESFCKVCLDKRVKKIIKKHKLSNDVDIYQELDILCIAFPESEHPEVCEDCGDLLDYVLLEDGVEEEIDHFLYFMPQNQEDIKDPRICTELLRIFEELDSSMKCYKRGIKLGKMLLKKIREEGKNNIKTKSIVKGESDGR